MTIYIGSSSCPSPYINYIYYPNPLKELGIRRKKVDLKIIMMTKSCKIYLKNCSWNFLYGNRRTKQRKVRLILLAFSPNTVNE